MQWILQGTVMAASAGMGCGTCCGTGISAVLFGYLTTHANDRRQAVRGFLTFYLGKITAVCLVCLWSSLLGTQLLHEDGKLFGIDVHLSADILMILFGIRLAAEWFREHRHKDCGKCRHRKVTGSGDPGRASETRLPAKKSGMHAGVLFGMGAGYGISPCAPLILVAAYAATLPWAGALYAGSIFAVFTALAPMMFLLILSGVLAPELSREIPEHLDRFRLLTYTALIVIFAVDFLTAVHPV